ncbi:MAG: sensor domain-containing diguanylate cyclase [Acidiferrobacterales bacterium]
MDNKVSVSALLKRFVLIYLPIVIVVSAGLWTVNRTEKNAQVGPVLAAGNYEVEKAREQITKQIKVAEIGLFAIANLNDMRRYLDSGKPKQRKELERYLVLLSQKMKYYDVIRYLDTSGQEVIRINYNDGKPAIVPNDQLKNRINRHFFRDTLNLDRGEMYVSPFELSVKQRHLAAPYRPTIRFGTPVFDGAGHKKGVVLINYSGSNLLRTFMDTMRIDDPYEGMLINRDGYWLSSSKHEDEWGFMLGKNGRTFGREFPEAWHVISTAKQGSLLNAQGLFVYSTVYVLQTGQRSSAGPGFPDASGQHQLAPYDYYWKIVFFAPNSVLFGKASYNQTGFGILFGTIYLLFMLASSAIAFITLRRKQDMDDLRIAAAAFEADEGIMITDQNARIIRTNRAFTRITGYSAAETIGKTPAIFHSGKQDAAFYHNMRESLLRDKYWHGETWNKRKNGDIYIEWLTITAVSDARGKVANYVAVLLDISERKQTEDLLRASELRHRLLFESSRDALMTLGPPSWKYTAANEAAVKLLGASNEDEILARGPWDFSPERQTDGRLSREKAQEIIAQAMHDGFCMFEWDTLRLNGETFTAELVLTRMETGKETFLQANVRDISERKRAEELLRDRESRYRLLFESSRDALMTLAPPLWKFTTANEAAVKLLGASNEDEILALDPLTISPEYQPDGRLSRERAPEIIAQALSEGSHMFEWDTRRLNGETFTAEFVVTRMEVGKEIFLQANVRDISERKRAEEKIRQLAFYDVLTQLPNRRVLDDRLARAMAASKRNGRYGALLFIDLDNFKSLNDSHGHKVGDLLLIEVAGRISRCVRAVDTVARFGGDEFIVMLCELDSDKSKSTAQAGIIAEKIRAAVSEHYSLIRKQDDGSETAVEHHCTASIGVVLFIDQEASGEDLVKWADTAMYQAKESGKNQVCFFATGA